MKVYCIVLLLLAAITALLGHSIGVVAGVEPWPLALGGAIVGAVACVLARAAKANIAGLEHAHSPRTLIGMRIGVAGFLVALAGWFLGVYWSSQVAVIVVGGGIIVGFTGMAIHAYMLFVAKNGA